MKDVLRDEKLRKLLKNKQRLEMFSWMIPVISIGFLLIILYFSLMATIDTLSLLLASILVILWIIAGYIFDNRITYKIHYAYSKLNAYFQDHIVPKLLIVDNPTIQYDLNGTISSERIDQIQLFNNYKSFNSVFHYEGELEKHKFTFDEVMFDDLVEYDSTDQKSLKSDLKKAVNYHWYTIELKKEYPVEALYKSGNFDNYDGRLIKKFQKFDFSKSRVLLGNDNELELFIKDLSESHYYTTDKIIKGLSLEPIVYHMVIAIFIQKNQLTIIVEEENDLIDLSHSNRIVIENLLGDYYEEQKAIKSLIKAFE